MSPLHTPAAGRGRVAQTVSACVHKRRWRLRIPNKRRNQRTGDSARAFRTSVSSPHPSCCVVQTKSQHASTKRDGGWWIPAEPRNLSTGDFAPAFRTCVPRNGSVSRERAANWWSRGGGRSHWPKASANRHVRWWISAERHCVRTQYFTHDLLTYIPTSDSVGRKPARQGTGQHAGGRPHHSQTKKAVVADRFLLSQRFPRSVRLEDPGSPRRRGALLMLEGYPMAG